MHESIPLTRPVTGETEERVVAEVIRSGWLTQGPAVEDFERVVAQTIGVGYGIAANSCTSALFVVLHALGIGSGDEVIVPSFSFIATANVVRHVGAKPVFADIELDTYNLDPERVSEKIGPRTRAIMPVDQVGFPCDMDAFKRLAEEYDLLLLQDAACALGSKYKDEPVGRRALAACFSFHPRKVVTCGEGGMIVTGDSGLAQRCRALVSHGATVDEVKKHQAKGAVDVEYPIVGYNFRLSSIQGAIAVAQMNRLDELVAARRELAANYRELFSGEDRLVLPAERAWAEPNYQSYMVRLMGGSKKACREVVGRMRARGVQAAAGIPSIHRQAAYSGYATEGELPFTELASDTTLFLPLYPGMSKVQQERVSGEVREALDAVSV